MVEEGSSPLKDSLIFHSLMGKEPSNPLKDFFLLFHPFMIEKASSPLKDSLIYLTLSLFCGWGGKQSLLRLFDFFYLITPSWVKSYVVPIKTLWFLQLCHHFMDGKENSTLKDFSLSPPFYGKRGKQSLKHFDFSNHITLSWVKRKEVPLKTLWFFQHCHSLMVEEGNSALKDWFFNLVSISWVEIESIPLEILWFF